MKWAFWIWTAVVVAVTVFVAGATTKSESYSGTNVTLTTSFSYNVVISGTPSLLEAASSDFFLLRKESGEAIVGVPAEKPLGWTSQKYYRASTRSVSSGEWIVEDGGNITIHVVSDQAMTIEKKWKNIDQINLIFLEVIGAIIVWLVGILMAPSRSPAH